MKTLTKNITLEFHYDGPYGDYCLTGDSCVFHKSLLETEDAETIIRKIQKNSFVVVNEETMDHYLNHGNLSLYNWKNYVEKMSEAKKMLESGDLSRVIRPNMMSDHFAYDVNGEPIKRAYFLNEITTHIYLQEINRYQDVLKEIMDHLSKHPQVKNLELVQVLSEVQRREGIDTKTPEFSFIPTDQQWTILNVMSDYDQTRKIFEFLGLDKIVSKYEKISN
jgi:hypothetical protein